MPGNDYTVNAYDLHAEAISARFRAIGVRSQDMQRALDLTGDASGISVVEIGSGDGRDAEFLVDKVKSYIGIEPSKGLRSIAERELPGAHFVNATAQSYEYPKNVDLIYAMASLLHVSKEDLEVVFAKISKAIRPGGILYLSMKEADYYQPSLQEDAWGLRQFYLYDVATIKQLAGESFEIVYEDHLLKDGSSGTPTRWFTLALRKVS